MPDKSILTRQYSVFSKPTFTGWFEDGQHVAAVPPVEMMCIAAKSDGTHQLFIVDAKTGKVIYPKGESLKVPPDRKVELLKEGLKVDG